MGGESRHRPRVMPVCRRRLPIRRRALSCERAAIRGRFAGRTPLGTHSSACVGPSYLRDHAVDSSWVLTDFIEFNDFLQLCDATVADLDLEGEIQVASFHPQYQFAGPGRRTSRTIPIGRLFPTLHLLREASVERALAAVPDPDSIYQNNIRRLRELGYAGWQALWTDECQS